MPTYSTWARRMAIWPTLTGCRKSMSSIAPSTTVPRATREAAMVAGLAIHCIMRPPWICPGAPACSGNTHWIISVAVSAIDGIAPLEPGRPARPGGRRPGRAGSVEGPGRADDAARVQAQAPDLRPRHRPVQAHVDREPRQILGEHRLRARVERLTLGAERELAGADQQVVQPRVAIKGEVPRARTLCRRLARRQRVEEEVRVAALRLALPSAPSGARRSARAP